MQRVSKLERRTRVKLFPYRLPTSQLNQGISLCKSSRHSLDSYLPPDSPDKYVADCSSPPR